jgi:hypothetical protein
MTTDEKLPKPLATWHGRGTAWAQHGMCELAFKELFVLSPKPVNQLHLPTQLISLYCSKNKSQKCEDNKYELRLSYSRRTHFLARILSPAILQPAT